MNSYAVRPICKHREYEVVVPGSKSITNRALLIAALANGKSILKGTLFSDDSRYFLSSLVNLGFDVDIDETAKTVTVVGTGGDIPKKNATIYVGSAGTAARFLTCMCGLSDGTYVIDASEQMKRRPMKPLMEALISLGASITYLEKEFHLPVEISGCGSGDNLKKKEVYLDISSSTQFLSALLMTGTMIEGGLTINITSEKKYGSYIGITLGMMKDFGIEATYQDGIYNVIGNSSYVAREYQIEPDVSAACYFYALAAITSSRVKVMNVTKNCTQGDIKFLDVLSDMGCDVIYEDDGAVVIGPDAELNGIEVDMNNFSDQTMTLAAIAIYANKPTKITGIGHIRLQESDRLSAIVNELSRMNVKTEYGEDYIVIYPGKPAPALIETYEDHRMAMAFTLVGLVTEGIVINDPMCCKKTFENYFEVIDSLYN